MTATAGGPATLLDEVLAANRAFLAGEPAPRPVSLGIGHVLVVTCYDPRLTTLLPRAMGIGPEELRAVRNAGGRVRPDGEAIRSIVAALVLGRSTEVFVVGHTDCSLAKAGAMEFLSGMARVKMDRKALGGAEPREWFGAAASERSTTLETARAIRKSPVLPPGTPVHALLIDTLKGSLELLERGYGSIPAAEVRTATPDSRFVAREAPKPFAAPEPKLEPPAPPRGGPPPAVPPPPRGVPPPIPPPILEGLPPPPPRKAGALDRAGEVLRKLRARGDR